MVSEAAHVAGGHTVDLERLLVRLDEPAGELGQVLSEGPPGVRAEVVVRQEAADDAASWGPTGVESKTLSVVFFSALAPGFSQDVDSVCAKPE